MGKIRRLRRSRTNPAGGANALLTKFAGEPGSPGGGQGSWFWIGISCSRLREIEKVRYESVDGDAPGGSRRSIARRQADHISRAAAVSFGDDALSRTPFNSKD